MLFVSTLCIKQWFVPATENRYKADCSEAACRRVTMLSSAAIYLSFYKFYKLSYDIDTPAFSFTYLVTPSA